MAYNVSYTKCFKKNVEQCRKRGLQMNRFLGKNRE